MIALFAFACFLAVANAGDVCVSQWNNAPCIKRDDAPSWMKTFYSDGDPCFTRNGGKVSSVYLYNLLCNLILLI